MLLPKNQEIGCRTCPSQHSLLRQPQTRTQIPSRATLPTQVHPILAQDRGRDPGHAPKLRSETVEAERTLEEARAEVDATVHTRHTRVLVRDPTHGRHHARDHGHLHAAATALTQQALVVGRGAHHTAPTTVVRVLHHLVVSNKDEHHDLPVEAEARLLRREAEQEVVVEVLTDATVRRLAAAVGGQRRHLQPVRQARQGGTRGRRRMILVRRLLRGGGETIRIQDRRRQNAVERPCPAGGLRRWGSGGGAGV